MIVYLVFLESDAQIPRVCWVKVTFQTLKCSEKQKNRTRFVYAVHVDTRAGLFTPIFLYKYVLLQAFLQVLPGHPFHTFNPEALVRSRQSALG